MRYFTAAAFAALVSLASGAAFTEVTNFGANPTGAKMFIYVPDKLQSSTPPLLVGLHWCSGSAEAFYNGSPYRWLADQYGFIVVYPSAPTTNVQSCWDVASNATLTHNAGGDSLAVANMVRYAISKHNIDASRVFVTGHSSGGMMTQTMIGAYPELFKAGASSAGVPFSCMRGPGYWSDDCAKGRLVKTGAEWGAAVKAAYPGYTGPRPKIALYHGTNDDTLYFANQAESVKQWTNIHGISETPVKTQSNNPKTNWTKYTYGNGEVVAVTGQGEPHNMEIAGEDVVAWFGLNSIPASSSTTTSTTTNTTPTTTTTSTTSTTTSTTSTTTSTTSTTTSTQPTATGTVKNKWEQCGGIGYTGSTICVSGSTCTKINDWYSQCL